MEREREREGGGEREIMIHTATRYHLSAPSVLEGNLCSSVSNSSVASCAVGSLEELILAVRRLARIRRGGLGVGLIESTGLYDSLRVFWKCFSICRWHVSERDGGGALALAYSSTRLMLKASEFF